ncbi:MAG: hypothetical protein WAK16_13540, partial [Candidatus Cybelea sp.]
MIALELTSEQRTAAEAAFDRCVAILGEAGSGKSTALGERMRRARGLHQDAEPLFFGSHEALDEFAVGLLRERGREINLIDDVEAEQLFTQACTPLFEMEWEELGRAQLDPEVPGLRSPERFLQSAFRLIRRLRDADIGPSLFLSRAMTGATEFYANPP